MQAVLSHTRMELKLFFREKLPMFFTFILPAVSFIVLGYMFGADSYNGLDFFQAYIPSMIAIIIFTTAFFSMGLQMVIDREKGVYKRLQGTPLDQKAIFTATVVKGFLAIYVGAIEIMLIAKLAFQTEWTAYPVQFFFALTLCSVTFFSLGFLVSALAKKMQTALGIAMVAMYPMMFLSDATVPLQSLPEALQMTSHFVPLTYVVHVLRDGWNGALFTSSAFADIAVLVGILIISTMIGMKIFRWTNEAC